MPGQLLHRIALRVCRDETERVLEPLIADLQREWSDARPGSARAFALARAYASFWFAVTACSIRTIARGVVSPIDREMTTAATPAFLCGVFAIVILRVSGSILGITGLRIFGNSWGYWHRPLSAIALGELQTVGWSVVFAMLPAFMCIRRDPNRRWDATASRILAAAVVIVVVFVGWLGPALFGASEHAQGFFLNGRAQPAFASITTVIRMVRNHSHAAWSHELDHRLTSIATALLLSLIGWQLSAIRRPSIGRVAFWWFVLMEFVLFSGGYAINQAEWQQWRASGVLLLILLALHTAARWNGSGLSAPPAPPDRPAVPAFVSS